MAELSTLELRAPRPRSTSADATRELGELPLPGHTTANRLAEHCRSLDVSHNAITSLVVTPTSQLSSVIASITNLCLARNRITTLHGIDAFVALEVLDVRYNQIHVIDSHGAELLRGLCHLRVVDLSHNAIAVIDLAPRVNSADVANGAGPFLPPGAAHTSNNSNNSSNPYSDDNSGYYCTHSSNNSINYNTAAAAGMMRWVVLNLSHNALMELPDCRFMPLLRVLNLDHNAIDSVSDIDVKLPVLHLDTLQLRYNRLPHVASVVALCVLANTLQHLQLYGNPFTMHRAGSDDDDEADAEDSTGCEGADGGRIEKHIPVAWPEHAPAKQKDALRGEECLPRRRVHVNRRWWWRSLLLWLAPHLRTLDAAEFTYEERVTATERLFREHGALSRRCLELLNPRRRDELARYVREQCMHVPEPQDMAATVELLEEMEEEQSVQQRQPSNEEVISAERATGGAAATTPIGRETRRRLSTTHWTAENAREESKNCNHSEYNDENLQMRSANSTLPSSTDHEGVGMIPYCPDSASTVAAASAALLTATEQQEQDGLSMQRTGSSALVPSSHTQRYATIASMTTTTQRPNLPKQPLAAVVHAMQQRLRAVSSVVETLWRGDVVRRQFAALVIQKHIRAALTRMHLDQETREGCQFARYQLQRLRQPHVCASAAVQQILAKMPYSQQHQQPRKQSSSLSSASSYQTLLTSSLVASAGVPQTSALQPRRVQRVTTGKHTKTLPSPSPDDEQSYEPQQYEQQRPEEAGCGGNGVLSGMQEVLASMRHLHTTMAHMWDELDELRAMSGRARHVAARTIQTRWRGYCARRHWRVLKADYDGFVRTLLPALSVMQCAGRGLSGRRLLAQRCAREGVVRQLRVEVAMLRGGLDEMKRVVMAMAKAMPANLALGELSCSSVLEKWAAKDQNVSGMPCAENNRRTTNSSARVRPIDGNSEDEHEDGRADWGVAEVAHGRARKFHERSRYADKDGESEGMNKENTLWLGTLLSERGGDGTYARVGSGARHIDAVWKQRSANSDAGNRMHKSYVQQQEEYAEVEHEDGKEGTWGGGALSHDAVHAMDDIIARFAASSGQLGQRSSEIDDAEFNDVAETL